MHRQNHSQSTWKSPEAKFKSPIWCLNLSCLMFHIFKILNSNTGQVLERPSLKSIIFFTSQKDTNWCFSLVLTIRTNIMGVGEWVGDKFKHLNLLMSASHVRQRFSLTMGLTHKELTGTDYPIGTIGTVPRAYTKVNGAYENYYIFFYISINFAYIVENFAKRKSRNVSLWDSDR